MRMPWVVTDFKDSLVCEKRNTEKPRTYIFGKNESEDAEVRGWFELIKPLCPLDYHGLYVDISDGVGRITNPATHDCRVVTKGNWSLSLEQALRIINAVKTGQRLPWWNLAMIPGEEAKNKSKISDALDICAMAIGETFTIALPKTADTEISEPTRKEIARWASGKGEMPSASRFRYLTAVAEAREYEEAKRRYGSK